MGHYLQAASKPVDHLLELRGVGAEVKVLVVEDDVPDVLNRCYLNDLLKDYGEMRDRARVDKDHLITILDQVGI